MKKLTLIISALALVLGMSQCKKPNVPEYTGTVGDRIIQDVTLKVSRSGNNNSNSKVSYNGVSEVEGEWVMNFKWDEKDKIIVYDTKAGCYSGTLTLNEGESGSAEGEFSGKLAVTTDSKLKFYYFGKNVTDNGDNTYSVDFSTQYGSIEPASSDDVSGHNIISNLVLESLGEINYEPSSLYEATMGLPYAVVRLKFENFGSGDIVVRGVESTGFSVDNTGVITMNEKTSATLKAPGTTDFYTVFMPKTSTEYEFESGTGYAKTANPWTLNANTYYTKTGTEGDKIVITGNTPTWLSGVFTVGPNLDDKVRFSRGNVQYQASTQTWQFAEHQYDAIRGGNENIGASWGGWIDLFGWGTTGYQDKRKKDHSNWYQKYYYPYSSSNAEQSHAAVNINLYGYGPDYYEESKYCLTVNDSSDWAIHFNTASENASTIKKGWRTLSEDEWIFLLNADGNIENYRQYDYRFAKTKVNGVIGIFLFPDNFTWTEDLGTEPENLNSKTAGYPSVGYNATQFDKIQQAGVVFLPITGNRSKKTVYNDSSTNGFGYYWTSTCYNQANAYVFRFTGYDFRPELNNDKHGGGAVRLVRPAE